jgi:hypothetical protein
VIGLRIRCLTDLRREQIVNCLCLFALCLNQHITIKCMVFLRLPAVREQTYEEALKEMMERIKSGKTLKPATPDVVIITFIFGLHDCVILLLEVFGKPDE